MSPQNRGAVAPPACRDAWRCSQMAVESHPPPLHGTQKTRRPQVHAEETPWCCGFCPWAGCPPVLADAESGLPQLNRVSGRFNPCQIDCIPSPLGRGPLKSSFKSFCTTASAQTRNSSEGRRGQEGAGN